MLVILDTCHAAATVTIKAQKKRGRLHILAAAASGVKTPYPGPRSFSTILCNLMKKHLKAKNQISVTELYTNLSHSKPSTGKVCLPMHCKLMELTFHPATSVSVPMTTDHRDIILRPLRTGNEVTERHIRGGLNMTVFLDGNITVQQLEHWLKSHIPDVVAGVEMKPMIQDALSLATRAQALLDDPRLESLVNSLPASTRRSFERRSEEYHLAIGKAAQKSQRNDPDETITTDIAQVSSSAAALDEEFTCPTLLDIPGDALNEILKDAQDHYPNLSNTVILRQAILGQRVTSDVRKIPLTGLKYASSVKPSDISEGKHFTLGSIGDTAVLVEYISMHRCDCNVNQIVKAASILSLPRSTTFRTLVSLGYIEDPSLKAYGFVFALPSPGPFNASGSIASRWKFLTLRAVMRQYKRVSLGSRCKLAHSVILAIESMHRVGWLHKGLNTEDIIFIFHTEDSKTYPATLPDPWLFGLQETRYSDSDSALLEDRRPEYTMFRHPERWGAPTTPFNETHDVHSLVSNCPNTPPRKARLTTGPGHRSSRNRVLAINGRCRIQEPSQQRTSSHQNAYGR